MTYHVKFSNDEQSLINQIMTTMGFAVEILHFDECYEVHTEYEFIYQELRELRAYYRGESKPLFAEGERVYFDGEGEEINEQP